MATRKTSVAIDSELFESAQKALGTNSLRETIEQAFLEVLKARARRSEIEALEQMRGMDLADPVIMAGAWRE